ncbi:MAG: hypothetical protein WC358_01680, partial [Ignavibacteria bacterium]
MRKIKLLSLAAVFFLICSNSFSQTVFEDASALNFKTDGTFQTAVFDPQGILTTAKLVKSSLGTFLEIGQFDEKGTYTKKSLIDLSDDIVDLRAKFNKNADKIIIFSKLLDDREFQLADVYTGEIINDLEPGDIGNFDFSPDGNTIAFSAGNSSYLYEITEGVIIQTYKDNVFLSFSKDGNMIYCKGKNDAVNYLNTKTGTV